MSDEQGYNGWTNYETWSVSLIVNNDKGLQDEAHEIVRNVLDDEGTTYDVAAAIQDWISQWEPTSDQFKSDEYDGNAFGYLWSQLIGAALSEVNWDEIAENMISDVRENA